MDAIYARPKLNRVPENLLKKRKLHEIRRARQARLATINEKKQKKEKINTLRFKRAEEFVKKRRSVDFDMRRIETQSRTRFLRKFQIPNDSKIAFVVRVKSDKFACKKVKLLLTLLRLDSMNSAVFVRLTPLTKQMLNILQPYIIWGFPDLKTIRGLILKRGFCRIEKCRVPISDNTIVEDNLGQHNLICVEDLINEIFTVGPHFKQASNFLWPFKFHPSKQRYYKSERNSIGDGKCGFRGLAVNQFIQKWM